VEFEVWSGTSRDASMQVRSVELRQAKATADHADSAEKRRVDRRIIFSNYVSPRS
jgi:hypothetical protein